MVGLYCELDVGAAGLDADLANDSDGGVAHLLILAVGKGLRRSDGNRIAGVHAHGIEVLDRADDDDVVFRVTHYLEFVLFPTQNRFFDESLVHGREIESAGEDFEHLFAVIRDTAARAAQREARAHNHGEADLAREFQAILQIVHQQRLRHVEADLLHGVFEEEAVFGFLDGLDAGADQLDVVLFQNAAVGKFDGEVERGLAADGGQHGEACAGRHFALDADDLFEILAGEWLDVGAVGDFGIGHDRGWIRVGQHDLEALGLEGLAGLGAGVVELGGLADDDGAGADNEDFGDVCAFRHL